MEVRRIGRPVKRIALRARQRQLEVDQWQQGQLRVHRGLVMPEFRLQIGFARLKSTGIRTDFQRHAIAQHGVADLGGRYQTPLAPGLAGNRRRLHPAEGPEVVRLEFLNERLLEQFPEFSAADLFRGGQGESVNLPPGNLPGLGIMIGNFF